MAFAPLAALPAALLLASLPGAVAADWAYEPPPLGAEVTYDDGRTSRVETVEGPEILLDETGDGGQELHGYRTWLLEVRVARPQMGVELTLEAGEGEEVTEAWPLEAGESIDLPYRILRDGSLVAEGDLTVTYEGEESLEVPAGTFSAHKLVHDLTFVRHDGQEVRTLQLVWHDAETGLILRLDYQTWQPEGTLEGSRAATAIDLP